MKSKLKYRHGFIIILNIVIGLIIGSISQVYAANPNPGVIPPNAKAYGMTYGEWSAKWWMWAYSMPVNQHPLYNNYDTTGVACSAGQSGKVWFLGGTFSATINGQGQVIGKFERKCIVPVGTTLFLPVINSEASTLEGDGSGDEALRAKATYYQNQATDLYATVDGVSIQNLQGYRVQSPLSQYGPLPLNNVPCNIGYGQDCNKSGSEGTNLVGQTSDFVGDGAYLMLPPLSAGDHTIKFGGKVPTFNFTLDGIYHVTVAPGGKK